MNETCFCFVISHTAKHTVRCAVNLEMLLFQLQQQQQQKQKVQQQREQEHQQLMALQRRFEERQGQSGQPFENFASASDLFPPVSVDTYMFKTEQE